jgi:hypothetical protein
MISAQQVTRNKIVIIVMLSLPRILSTVRLLLGKELGALTDRS